MKIALRVKRASYLLAVVFLVVGFLPITSVQVAFADDGTQSAPEAVEPADEAPSQPAESPEPETADTDEVNEVDADAPEIPTDVDETVTAGDEEIPSADLQPEEANIETELENEAVSAGDEETEDASGGIDELVALIHDEGVEIADDSGEPLDLAGEDAVEALSNQDPFFWDGTQWVGYTKTGTGCPTNVDCRQDNFPVQKAVSMAGSGNTVYFAGGSYDEDVVLNIPDLSFVGIQNVTILDQFNPGITVDNTGYALIKSLTLNVNFNVTNGVYATTIIVNGPNGRLNDGLALVNTGGTVEADIVLQSGGGYYIIKDAHDPASPEYEWECGEPDVLIYHKGTSQNPSGEYRMVFMPPSDDDIINYYSLYSTDERTDRNPPPNLVGTPLSALDRLEDLIIGVNVSQQSFPIWNHTDERLIYWNLLGNMGTDANGQSTTLNAGQQSMADSITNGSNDGIARTWGIWFLWPKIEDPNNKNGKGPLPVSAFQTATEKPRQLTFIDTPVRQITGCTDPKAMNYDPNATINRNCHYAVYGCTDPKAINQTPGANTDDGSCAYRATPAPQPAPPGNTIGFIPVTGTGGGGPVEDLLLIPVTGVDLAEQRMLKINELVFLAGFTLLSSGLIMRMGKKRDQI